MEKQIKQYSEEDDEIVIDLQELFFEFKKKIWILIAALVLGTGAAGLYSYFLITPQYTSEAKIYVLSKETTLTSLADLQIGSQLTKDYQVIIDSRPVMEDVIKNLGLDMDYKELRKKITIENPKDTRILTLSATDPDPVLAKEIVDAIADSASDYIGELMEMTPPKLIEDGVIATEKTSPSVKKNALIGGLLALFAAAGVIALKVVLNDTIKTEEDVAKYLDLPVLAVIPEWDADRNEKGKSKKERQESKKKRKRESRRKNKAGKEEAASHE